MNILNHPGIKTAAVIASLGSIAVISGKKVSEGLNIDQCRCLVKE